ncbi:MAG TPA: TlpA disulfide reductase family protein [Rhodoferax sp.]|nr:TlpA disulfide reductase family protein [Rhodoferax sp.]HNV61097.1 TlpA disulfide reductase family protein [Rhodoferax sp.]HPW30009.1 TlpA disulfide reductase family protein [Rhodoferax sp.]
MKILNTLFLCAIALCSCALHAQVAAVTGKPTATLQALSLQAHNMGGEPFAINTLQGKVAIVFFWSTSCAVCRDSLPELRTNLAGWRDKPFALVTVNVDAKASDWLAYESILSKTKMPPKTLYPLRLDEGKPIPPKLPLTLLVNAQGKVVARYEGRLAPEAWDGVADLLP